jgi:predicted transposase/invertase (TIGR01784 family)
MQCYNDNAFLKRACFYASRAYVNQKIKGINYADLKPIRFLAILKESIFPKKKAYLSRHEYRDVYTNEWDIDEFVFTFLELGKINKTAAASRKIIEKWVYFFKHAPDTTDDDLTRLTQEYPVINNAYQSLGRFNYSTEEMDEYYRYDMKADEIKNLIAEGRAEGLAEGEAKGKMEGLAEGKAEGLAEGEAKGKMEGLAEGKAEGKAEGLAEGEAKGKVEAMRNMVIKLHQQGANRDLIINVTGLSLKEIERIIKEASKN